VNVTSWLKDGWGLARVTSSANDGSPTYGSVSTIKGYTKTVYRRVPTPQGVQIFTATVFWTTTEVKAGDRVWAPGTDTTKPLQARRLGQVTSQTQKYGELTLYEADLQ